VVAVVLLGGVLVDSAGGLEPVVDDELGAGLDPLGASAAVVVAVATVDVVGSVGDVVLGIAVGLVLGASVDDGLAVTLISVRASGGDSTRIASRTAAATT